MSVRRAAEGKRKSLIVVARWRSPEVIEAHWLVNMNWPSVFRTGAYARLGKGCRVCYLN